ncbi:ankyrin repeat-containing domain protein [Cercophora newfieldiana]|uniref:Ankyrin repeat-containing domain protein n=1 Tax=Cercophora newfieldiana TaxID=92897 RepID=A0AA39YH94_9PEZI|nr:ankyrin repeat-containing domain protein [Cercophora newfieldiana]
MISRLAPELLLLVGEKSEELLSSESHTGALHALVSTCKYFHQTFERRLYKFNIDKAESSVMTFGAAKGRVDILKKALSYGAAIDATGQHREARLDMIAKIHSNTTFPTGIMISMVRMNGSPLHYAIAGGHTETAKLLVQHGAETGPGCPVPFDWWSAEKLNALSCAAKHGNAEMVRYLVTEAAAQGNHAENTDANDPSNANADYVNQQGDSNETALHLAAGIWIDRDEYDEEAATEVCKTLVSLGADLEIQ